MCTRWVVGGLVLFVVLVFLVRSRSRPHSSRATPPASIVTGGEWLEQGQRRIASDPVRRFAEPWARGPEILARHLPGVIEWDAKLPGFYEQFRPAFETNPRIRKGTRQCNVVLPDETTDVEYTVGITLVRRDDGTYSVSHVSVDYEGIAPDGYLECIRQLYLDERLLPRADGPAVIRIGTFVRMYFPKFTPTERRAYIDRLHEEMVDAEDENTRQNYIDLVDYMECVDRIGRERWRECV